MPPAGLGEGATGYPVPEAGGTRFAGLDGLRLPGARLLGPANRWWLTRRLGHGAIGRLAERVRSP